MILCLFVCLFVYVLKLRCAVSSAHVACTPSSALQFSSLTSSRGWGGIGSCVVGVTALRASGLVGDYNTGSYQVLQDLCSLGFWVLAKTVLGSLAFFLLGVLVSRREFRDILCQIPVLLLYGALLLPLTSNHSSFRVEGHGLGSALSR